MKFDKDAWQRPSGDELVAGVLVVGALVVLVVIARAFRDVAAA